MELTAIRKLTRILPEKARNFWLHILEGVFASFAVSWLLFAQVDEVPQHTKSKAPKKHIAYFKNLINSIKKKKMKDD